MRTKVTSAEQRARKRERNLEMYRKNPNVWRNSHLRRKYGISVQQFDELFERQERKCACCRSTNPKSKDGWSVDHDHETGVVRGIICSDCNRFLGAAHDPVTGARDNLTALEASYMNTKRYLTAVRESASVDTRLSSE